MSAIQITIQPEQYCPPCEFFKPEIIETSFSWKDGQCDSSVYVIGCEHYKVCRTRWKVDEYRRGYQYGLYDGINDTTVEKRQALDVDSERTCRNDMEHDDSFVCSECGCHVRETQFGCSFTETDGKRWFSTSNEHHLRYCPNCGARVVE